jgi:deazaflavin-dependent oxidoreductase (nitroreductase family)
VPDEAGLGVCYLTTTGRRSGEPHEIEIWFALHEGTVYLLSGGRDRSDWVRNLMASPAVTLRLGEREIASRARVVSDPGEDALARRLLREKYGRGGDDLASWAATSLPIAVAWRDADG